MRNKGNYRVIKCNSLLEGEVSSKQKEVLSCWGPCFSCVSLPETLPKRRPRLILTPKSGFLFSLNVTNCRRWVPVSSEGDIRGSLLNWLQSIQEPALDLSPFSCVVLFFITAYIFRPCLTFAVFFFFAPRGSRGAQTSSLLSHLVVAGCNWLGK